MKVFEFLGELQNEIGNRGDVGAKDTLAKLRFYLLTKHNDLMNMEMKENVGRIEIHKKA